MLPVHGNMQPSCFALLGFSKPFQVESNASNTTVDVVLIREHIPFHKPITFLSNTFTSSEKNDSVYKYKLLAIFTYCKAWHPYIDGQAIFIITDHKPLIYLHT